MHTLRDKVWTAGQSKTGFPFSFYCKQCNSGVVIADVCKKKSGRKKGRWPIRGIPERIRRSSRRWKLQKLSQSLVCQMVHTSTWSFQEVVPARIILWAVLESRLEYEDIQTETKLDDCASVAVVMRNGEVGMKYVRDGELGWILVVRRRKKKSAGSVDGDDSGNSNIKLNLIEGRINLLRYR